MIPITRKELYLNKIVGNNDYETPEKPITIEEFFFAEILGEAVQAPEPLTRYQIYLAKIAGREIEIPYPETRLEYFLARAAGMDISTPVPITREEIFWSNYSAIVDFEIEGIPPLSFKAKAGALRDYRIYGNTVDGESVGDRTANLFGSELVLGSFIAPDGSWVNVDIRCISEFINVKSNTTYSLHITGAEITYIGYYGGGFSFLAPRIHDEFTFVTPNDCNQIRIVFSNYDNSIPIDLTVFPKNTVMLNEGSTPLPYEPYGYKVPVTVSNGTDTQTTPIYLPEPIKMVGDEAEYIDYGEQKQHRVRKNLFDGLFLQGYWAGADGQFINANNWICTKKIPCKSNTTYTLSFNSANSRWYGFLWYTENGDFILSDMVTYPQTQCHYTASAPSNAAYMAIDIAGYPDYSGKIFPSDVTDFMLVEGSAPLPYEPYIENTELDVILPALPTFEGTNVLSVNTEVQPSKVYIKGEKGRD